jgi:hypothetical protein
MTNDANTTAAPAVGTPLDCGVGRPEPERDDVGLLKAAADALGLQYEWHHGCGDALHLTAPDATAIYWNPLASDADALALAVRMEMDVFVRAGRWTEAVRPMGPACKELHNGDPLAATRRAIVRAAAECRKPPNV